MKALRKTRHLFGTCLLTLMLFVSFSSVSFAEEGQNESNSNGAIGFYGDYQVIEEPKPEPPATIIAKPIVPSPVKASGLAYLPQTNESQSFAIMALGGALICQISLIMFIKKRRTSND